MSLSLYFDDDSGRRRLVSALRNAGIDAVSSRETGSFGIADHEHLAFATQLGRVICTSNIGDFLYLHRQWLSQDRHHAGIILITQQRFSLGEQLRRFGFLNKLFEMDDIADRFEFISDWGEP